MPHQSILGSWILTPSLTSGMGAVGAGSARGTWAIVIATVIEAVIAIASATVAVATTVIASVTVGALTGTGAAVTITVAYENRVEEIGGRDTMSANHHGGSTSAAK